MKPLDKLSDDELRAAYNDYLEAGTQDLEHGNALKAEIASRGTAYAATCLVCDVCNSELAVGVAAVPGMPMSVAYGVKCLEANAHPWHALVINTAMIGGYDQTAPWWKLMVDDTCKHLGKTRGEFDADVVAAIKDMDTQGM